VKKILLSTVLCLSMAGAVAADSKPKVTKGQLHSDMVVSTQDAAASSSWVGLFIPLAFLVALGVAASSNGSGYAPYTPPGS
jgi:hypothetical protein